MRRFKVGVVLVLPLFVLVTILASLPGDPVRAQGRGSAPSDVNVVNTPTVNAQQAGSWNVAVSGTPTINAQQEGPWDVGVAGLTNRITASARAVIDAGEVAANVSLPAPSCPAGTGFLVTEVHVGPEVLIGATSINVVQLQNWAVSVPVFQFSEGSASQVALTALGNGPEAISASIPAGQHILGSTLQATVIILGGGSASHRFEFNIHLTGFCGVGFSL